MLQRKSRRSPNHCSPALGSSCGARGARDGLLLIASSWTAICSQGPPRRPELPPRQATPKHTCQSELFSITLLPCWVASGDGNQANKCSTTDDPLVCRRGLGFQSLGLFQKDIKSCRRRHKTRGCIVMNSDGGRGSEPLFCAGASHQSAPQAAWMTLPEAYPYTPRRRRSRPPARHRGRPAGPHSSPTSRLKSRLFTPSQRCARLTKALCERGQGRSAASEEGRQWPDPLFAATDLAPNQTTTKTRGEAQGPSPEHNKPLQATTNTRSDIIITAAGARSSSRRRRRCLAASSGCGRGGARRGPACWVAGGRRFLRVGCLVGALVFGFGS